MKNFFYKYLFLFTMLVFFTACDSYLDVEPKGFTIPTTVEDYDLLLNGGPNTIHTTTDEEVLFMTADDFDSGESLGDLEDPSNRLKQIYTWDSNLFNEDNSELSWNTPYENIYTYNLIINNVDGSEFIGNYNEQDKQRIKAEAKVGRAYEYWLLVNTFAKQYNAATASTDMGVPIVTEASVSGSHSGRVSIQEIYDLIISDVEESIKDLPDTRVNKVRPSKAAGYAFLARFYLSMNNYEKAKINADMAINLDGEIEDYNYGGIFQGYPKEQYINRYFQGTLGYFNGVLGAELTQLLPEEDSRLYGFLTESCNWVYSEDTGWEYICLPDTYSNSGQNEISHAVSIPEMYLIRAECNARIESGTIDEVVNDLNDLRSKRINPNAFTALSSADFANKTEALTYVLEERRRELFMSGMRLFTVKRLNLEPNYAKTITHTVLEEEFTATPGSNKLILPIPGQVMKFNPEMTQNPRD